MGFYIVIHNENLLLPHTIILAYKVSFGGFLQRIENALFILRLFKMRVSMHK